MQYALFLPFSAFCTFPVENRAACGYWPNPLQKEYITQILCWFGRPMIKRACIVHDVPGKQINKLCAVDFFQKHCHIWPTLPSHTMVGFPSDQQIGCIFIFLRALPKNFWYGIQLEE